MKKKNNLLSTQDLTNLVNKTSEELDEIIRCLEIDVKKIKASPTKKEILTQKLSTTNK